MQTTLLLAFLVMLTGFQDPELKPLAADLILYNAEIWTGVQGQPPAQSIAIRGQEIIAVGTNAAIQAYKGKFTRTLDWAGRFVMPGFIDNHAHFLDGGFQLLSVDLRPSLDEKDFAERIKRYAEKLPGGTWITGGDWDHESWPSARLPRKELIDAHTYGHPVFVQRLDGHMALANSLALKLARVSRGVPDPPGGLIVRDAAGEPTGILKDAAMDRVYKVIPPPSDAARRRAALAALEEARRLGVTTVNAMASYEEIRTFHRLLKEGKLTTRIYGITPLPDYKNLREVGIDSRFGNPFLKIGALKGYMDGSLGSSTAWFYRPYDDAPQTSGLPSSMWFPEGNMKRLISEGDRSNFHIAVHAIGDRANDELLNIYEQVSKENRTKERRVRIEHAQHLTREAIPRFGKLGVIASMQPYHAIDDGRWAEKRIGTERIKTTYAFRSLLDTGAVLTFGSDWPVAPLNPLLGVYAAVTRRTLDGKNPNGWVPEQKISVEEALICYTRHNAYAMFAEDELGTLEAGKLADMVVLSANPIKIDPVEIQNLQVQHTIVGGKIVYP